MSVISLIFKKKNGNAAFTVCRIVKGVRSLKSFLTMICWTKFECILRIFCCLWEHWMHFSFISFIFLIQSTLIIRNWVKQYFSERSKLHSLFFGIIEIEYIRFNWSMNLLLLTTNSTLENLLIPRMNWYLIYTCCLWSKCVFSVLKCCTSFLLT